MLIALNGCVGVKASARDIQSQDDRAEHIRGEHNPETESAGRYQFFLEETCMFWASSVIFLACTQVASPSLLVRGDHHSLGSICLGLGLHSQVQAPEDRVHQAAHSKSSGCSDSGSRPHAKHLERQ